jgi:hypothetical protein
MDTGNMILVGFEDRSIDIIQSINSRFDGDHLAIQLFTQHQTYEGQMPLNQCTQEPLDKFKMCLENIECMDVKADIDHLSLICYDIPISLTNSKLVKYNELQQKYNLINKSIADLYAEIDAKKLELAELERLIVLSLSELRNQNLSSFKEETIFKKDSIQEWPESEFIALMSSTNQFSQLQRIYCKNKLTGAGLKALAENGHKFSQL